jgi:hypothetical protein
MHDIWVFVTKLRELGSLTRNGQPISFYRDLM